MHEFRYRQIVIKLLGIYNLNLGIIPLEHKTIRIAKMLCL